MRRYKIIIAGLSIVIIVGAILVIIKDLHLWPAAVGVMIVRDAEITGVKRQPSEPADSSEKEQASDSPDNTASQNSPDTKNYTDTKDSQTSSAQQTAGDDASATTLQGESEMFRFTELTPKIKDRITGISYPERCEVPYDELRYVEVLYWGFDGETHTGELIVNQAIAQDIVDIFVEFYEQKYPIEKMVLVDEFKADDNLSMAADNTSSFNYRPIDDGSGRLSLHSYGLAIDINPLYNPYVREVDGATVISPEEGAEYANRSADCEYYIRKDDICWKAFTSRGFTWGGDWKNQKDYQHFQKKPDQLPGDTKH